MNSGLSHSGEFETQLLECPLALGSILIGILGALWVFLRRGKTVNLALGMKSNECVFLRLITSPGAWILL